ncbi:MAG: asparagine synthase-related protein [Sphingomonas sp.]|uniref:asparagine synthetase B family protein n=1 Tax=Sphingomonas sp. TaxID=28214 RepID=UPI00356835AE
MGEFVGIFRRDGGIVDESVARRFGSIPGAASKPRIWRGTALCVAYRPYPVSRLTEGGSQPVEIRDGVVVVSDVRLDDPASVAAMLDAGADHVGGDAALVARACARWGIDAASRLRGSFAFALWDEERRRLSLARDPLGSRPLFYVEHARHIVFGTALPTLLALSEVPREMDELVLAQYLTRENRDQERTLYRDIRRVPPGGIAIFDADSARIRRYWTIDDIKPVRLRADDDYVEAGREMLDRAVASCISRSGKLGATLSGGLDSSGAVATAARLRGTNGFTAFNRAPGSPHPYGGMDERLLAGEVAARYPHVDLVVVDDRRISPRDTDPAIEAAAMGIPRGGSVNITWFESVMIAAEQAGIDVLMGGGLGNLTLSWDGAPNFRADLAGGRWASASRGIAMAARTSRRSIPSFLAHHLARPVVPRKWRRLRLLTARGSAPWLEYCLISPDFLSQVDYMRHARESDADVMPAQTRPYREQRLAALQSQAPRDIASFGRRKWRFENRDPYGDLRLVEFTLAIPDNQYWRGGVDRWLARRVLADRIPPSLAREWRRGRQCPEWYTIVSARRDGMAAAIDTIARSPLASRVVDVPRMRRLLDDWPRDAEAAKDHVQIYGHAMHRAIAMGGFLRWYEGGNE